MNELLERLRDIPPNTEDIERVMREEATAVAERPNHHDLLRAHAINAILKAKGVDQRYMLDPYEATKVWIILAHLEELAGYSG